MCLSTFAGSCVSNCLVVSSLLDHVSTVACNCYIEAHRIKKSWYVYMDLAFTLSSCKLQPMFKHLGLSQWYSALNFTLERVCPKEWAMFRPSSTGLDRALVVFDLTQILAEGSRCRRGGGVADGIPDHDSVSDQSQTTDAWSRPVDAGETVLIRFDKKFTIIFILGAMNYIFHNLISNCVLSRCRSC